VEHVAPDQWRLTLTIGSAERRMEAASCAQLARAGALFLALVMDTSGGNLSSAAPSEPPPVGGPPAPTTPRDDIQRPTDGGARADERLGLSRGAREVLFVTTAGVIVDTATMPHIALLGALGVGIRYRSVEVGI